MGKARSTENQMQPSRLNRRALSLLALLVTLSTTACASSTFSPGATFHGTPRSALEVVKTADAMDEKTASDVEVLVGQLPEGVAVEGGAVRVDPARYELLGTVTAKSNGVVDFVNFWFYPYAEDEAWRKGFCYWQVPLTWVTLTIVSPLAYPCKVIDGGSSAAAVEGRKDKIMHTLRRATKAMGGDLLIVTSSGSTNYVDLRSGTVVGTTEATGGEGLALRRVVAARLPPPSQPPVHETTPSSPPARAPTGKPKAKEKAK